MATWEETAQDWGGQLLKGAVDQYFYQDYNLKQMQLQALGENGYYDEGKVGITQEAKTQAARAIPTTWLLVGGAVLLVFLMKS